MKKVLIAAAALAAMIQLCGCDAPAPMDTPPDNRVVYLSPGTKLEGAAFDMHDHLYVLTRPMQEGESPREYRFQSADSIGTAAEAANGFLIVEEEP